MSLNNLGNSLSNLGRRDDALAVTQEAVDILRTLAAAHSDTFLPHLAGSLSNLGNRLLDLGRCEDALAVTQEAVAIRRTLASARPDAFLRDLATSLGAHGQALRAAGHEVRAMYSFVEGAEQLMPAFERLPQAFGQLMSGLLRDAAQSSERRGSTPAELLSLIERYNAVVGRTS